MPYTVNGIGTWYYGRGGLQTRLAPCPFCGRKGVLATYETRLWFVVLFLPVIPLGKRKIFDQCPACKRHRVMPLTKWKEVESEALRKAMEQAEQKPGDGAAAINLHATLVGCRRQAEARRMADVMLADFPNDAAVFMYLAEWYAASGSPQDAQRCFARALELNPDEPAVRRAVAMGCIGKGDLGRARELLRGTDAPGPNQAPGALQALADAYHARGEHQNALEFYEAALRLAPAMGQHRPLRKRIAVSAAALGRPASMLPRLQRRLGKFYAAAAIVLAAMASLLAYNYYRAQHQGLNLVNGLPGMVSISIDGGQGHVVLPGGRQRVVVAEGSHQAVVRQQGRDVETIPFQISDSFFGRFRFSRGPVYVLNPRGAASLVWQEHLYSAHPDPRRLPRYQIHFGQEFSIFCDIDYPFETPPKTLHVEHNAGETPNPRILTTLAVFYADPMTILGAFPPGTAPQELVNFIEHHLTIAPDNDELLTTYFALTVGSGQGTRCRDFLKRGLKQRPIVIEWHRMYQEACELQGGEPARGEYEAMLAADPHNSALLYLVGRLEPERSKAADYYQRAIDADARNAYPRMALAFDHVSDGDFAGAKSLAGEACRLRPRHAQMADLLYDIRFALNEYEPLEKELRQRQVEESNECQLQKKLLQVLAAQGKRDAARAADAAYAERMSRIATGEAADAALQSRLALDYLLGDMRDYLAESRRLKRPADGYGVFAAQLELDSLPEAQAALNTCGDHPPADAALLMSLAWSEDGQPQRAAEWRKKAVEALRSYGRQGTQMIALLEKGDVRLSEVGDVPVAQPMGAVFLAVLAEGSKAGRAELLQRARVLNTNTFFPHEFLRRMLAKMRAQPEQ